MEPRKWSDDSRWLSMGVDDDGALYYTNNESISKDGDGIKVEIRAIPLQGKNQSDIPTGTSYICQQWKVYPNKHVFDLLNFRFYDANGRLISFVPQQGHMEIKIKPGSVAENIMTEVCKESTTATPSESSVEMFNRQYREALHHDKLPFLIGTTRVAMQWIIGCALFVFFWFVADQLIFRESFSRSSLGAEIILFLSTMASYFIVKALFGGLGR